MIVAYCWADQLEGKAMRLGTLESKALTFIRKVKGWHSFAQDPTTKRVVKSLESKGLVEINRYHQFRDKLLVL